MSDPALELILKALDAGGLIRVAALRWLPRRFVAITLPPLGVYIRRSWYEIATAEAYQRVLRHEAVHWLQWERWHWWTYPRYLGLWLRYGYRNHPHEIEARRRAS